MYRSSNTSSPPSSSPSTVEDDHKLRQALAGLQLPHMPTAEAAAAHDEEGIGIGSGEPDLSGMRDSCIKGSAKRSSIASSLPTIRILIVADIDLPSASWLAEYTLQQQRGKNQSKIIFDAGRIDLCIACGSFCRDDDLRPYQSLANQLQQQKARRSHAAQQQQQQHQQWCINNTPFFRSREETAALEGLLTASLSQLESIVCRVIYCPGATDPLTTLVSPSTASSNSSSSNGNNRTSSETAASARRAVESASFPYSMPPRQQTSSSISPTTSSLEQKRRAAESLRLTPNSRNIHQQWLPMAPGLGCAGLLYLESPEMVVNACKNMNRSNRRRGSGSSRHSRLHGKSRGSGGTGLGGALSDDVDDDGENSYNDDEAEHEDDDEDDEDDEVAVDGTATPPQHDIMMKLAEQLVTIQQSSEGYCSTLSRLLQLAPPIPHHTVPFTSEQAQSILVTHYVDLDAPPPPRSSAVDDNDNHHDNDDIHCIDDYTEAAAGAAAAAANGSPSWAIEQPQQQRDLPFPMQDHDLFIHSLLAQRMLCLEIASGSASHRPARLIKKGRVHLLLPGSLRKRGEFSIVDVSLTPDEDDNNNKEREDDDEDNQHYDAVIDMSTTRNTEEDEVDQARSQHFKTTKTATTSASSKCGSKPTRYRWTVSNVEFHNVNDLP